MAKEENKTVVERLFKEVFNGQRLDAADELVAPDYLDHGAVPGQGPGLEGAKQRWSMYFAAIPDMYSTIDDAIAEGDRVVVRYSVKGTQKGPLMGLPPTGKTFHTSGISIYRLTNGKIVEQWEQADMIGLMQQLGALPKPGHGGN